MNAAGASPGRLDGSAGLIFALWVLHPRSICGGRISGIECFATAVVVGLSVKLSDFGTRWSSYFVLIGGVTALPMGVAPEIELNCLQLRLISINFQSKEFFDTLPMGVNGLDKSSSPSQPVGLL